MAVLRSNLVAWNRLKHWPRQLANSRWGLGLMTGFSFLETIIVPIPIEIILIPYMLSRRDLLWLIAFLVTAGCLVAAGVGYAVGYFLFESVGRDLLVMMAWEQDFQYFKQWFAQYGFWAVVAIGITPVPFQVAMLVAGASGYPLVWFILAATFARGIRYFGLALLVVLVGDKALALWQQHKKTLGITLSLFVLVLFTKGWWASFLTPGG